MKQPYQDTYRNYNSSRLYRYSIREKIVRDIGIMKNKMETTIAYPFRGPINNGLSQFLARASCFLLGMESAGPQATSFKGTWQLWRT